MPLINKLKIYAGADPEVFILDAAGQPVPAVGLIPGTKENPYEVPGGMIQVDGLAAEFGIDPSFTADEFVHNLKKVMGTLQSMLPEGHRISIQPTVEFTAEQLVGVPAESLLLGCDPDFNAYTMAHNPTPVPPTPGFRSAGGHLHIGWGANMPHNDPKFMQAGAALTAELDFFLGIPSAAWDSDMERRSVYGKAGAFRPKPYGMEYRVLSNMWLKDESLMRFVFNRGMDAVQSVMNGVTRGNTPIKVYPSVAAEKPRTLVQFGWDALGRHMINKLNKEGGNWDVQ